MEDFLENAEVALSSFIRKPSNRRNIALAIWKQSARDKEYANYLLYEIFAEYLVSPKLDEVYASIRQKQLGWAHTAFSKFEEHQKEHDDFLVKPPELEEGVIQCSRCGSKKTFSFSKQTRRADESATVFVRCAECGKSFRM